MAPRRLGKSTYTHSGTHTDKFPFLGEKILHFLFLFLVRVFHLLFPFLLIVGVFLQIENPLVHLNNFGLPDPEGSATYYVRLIMYTHKVTHTHTQVLFLFNSFTKDLYSLGFLLLTVVFVVLSKRIPFFLHSPAVTWNSQNERKKLIDS